MPTVFQALIDTMIFAAGGAGLTPLTPNVQIAAPEPNPTVSRDTAVRLKNPVWSWTHDPAQPNKITNLQSKVLGMGMNYSHSMLVCQEISVDEVKIVTKTDDEFFLPTDSSFVMHKWNIKQGTIPAKTSTIWPLQAEIDQSIMVVFGYQVVNGAVKPFTRDQATQLGDKAMPPLGQESTPDPVKVGEVKNVVVSPLRVLVCFALTCCKERNDFEPGGVLGANRVHPHVQIMSSLQLKSTSAVITVKRPPATTPSHPDPEMGPIIRPILFTDSNLPRANTVGPALPHWENMFDYHEVDPLGQGLKAATVVEGDPASKRAKERRVSGLLKKGNAPADLRKMPRQGDFDNLHMAPRMEIPPIGPFSRTADPRFRASMQMDNVIMAPFCVHDCLHTHFRWGVNPLGFLGNLVLLFPDSAKGFDNQFNAFRVEGAPHVPHNQTVRISILSGTSFSYEGIVNGPVEPGRWHVLFHHGMAYANDLFDVPTVDKARIAVEVTATGAGEHFFNKNEQPTPSLNAGDFFSVFYWRMRFGGTQNNPVERLAILAKDAARDF